MSISNIKCFAYKLSNRDFLSSVFSNLSLVISIIMAGKMLVFPYLTSTKRVPIFYLFRQVRKIRQWWVEQIQWWD
jgi:hypothetical protein